MKGLAINLFRLIFALLMALPLSACSLSGGTIEGRVLEEGTDKSIPDAIVVVRWIGRTTSGSMFVESRNICYHVETAITDGKGRYQTKGWNQEQHKDYTLKFDHVLVDAYKRNYGLSQTIPRNDKDVYLAQFKGTREERLKYLERMARSSGCHAAGESEEDLYLLYEALYYEAKENAAKEENLQWYREVAAAIAVGISDQFTNAENEKRIQQFLRNHLQ